MDAEKKIEEAVKLSTKRTFPFNIFSSYDPITAADLFQEAGHAFSSQDMYQRALDCFLKASEIFLRHLDSYSKTKAAQCFLQISSIYCRDPVDGEDKHIYFINEASDLYASVGNYSLSASTRKPVFEYYKKMNDFAKATSALKTIISDYLQTNMKFTACLYFEEYLMMLLKSKDYVTARQEFWRLSAYSNDKNEMILSYLCLCFYLGDHELNLYKIPPAFFQSKLNDVWQALCQETREKFIEEKNNLQDTTVLKPYTIVTLDIIKHEVGPEVDIC